MATGQDSDTARVCVTNARGGTGKATVAINVAGALNERGRDVLLVDLDPQGNATEGLGLVESLVARAEDPGVDVGDSRRGRARPAVRLHYDRGDHMTDDDRMDRARRIHEMREGDRPDAQADDDPNDVPTDDPGGVSGGREDAATTEGEGGGTLQVPAAEMDDVEVDVEELARQAGLDAEGVGDAGVSDHEEGVAGPAGMAEAADRGVETAAETRVLEFDLGDERYCLDIEHVEEIVERETVTRVPNTPDYVEGVVDLRGQITTILDPKALLDIDAEGAKQLIVVFDPEEFEDQGAIGWVVDDVNQVTPVTDDEVNDSPVDEDHINGVVERDGEFVIWTDPGVAIETAAG